MLRRSVDQIRYHASAHAELTLTIADMDRIPKQTFGPHNFRRSRRGSHALNPDPRLFDRWRRHRSVAQEKPTCLRDRISDDLESAWRFPMFARTKGSRSQAFNSTSRPARSLAWCTSMMASREERATASTSLKRMNRSRVSKVGSQGERVRVNAIATTPPSRSRPDHGDWIADVTRCPGNGVLGRSQFQTTSRRGSHALNPDPRLFDRRHPWCAR
jgi:hypothetical protein